MCHDDDDCSLNADNRCFLIGGGSAETFFVSENATVGSVIGMKKKEETFECLFYKRDD